jgi:hypothetical protein
MSLAIDYGRYVQARGELFDVAESAARYAATGLVDGTASTKALASASSTTIDGSAFNLQAADVTTGFWNTASRTFTTGSANPNAVRVSAKRNASRGNAVDLAFARVIGLQSPQLNATVVAYKNMNVMLVVGNTTLVASDTAVRNRLQNLGFSVVVTDDAAVTAADALEMRLVVVSETSTSTLINTKLRDAAVPVLCYEPMLYDDMSMTGPTESTNFGCSNVGNRINITNASHALAAGLASGTQTVTSLSNTVSGAGLSWGLLPAGATRIANVQGSSTQAALFAYDTGATLYNGTAAPARRVGMFMCSPDTGGNGGVSASALNTNGWAIFDAAVTWLTTPTPAIRTVKFSQ